MKKTRLELSHDDILTSFEALGTQTLKSGDLRSILASKRMEWKLAKKTSLDEFVAFLKATTKLREMRFAFPQREETIYTWGDVPLLFALQRLRKDLYFSHQTAMRMNSLCSVATTDIYLMYERSRQSLDPTAVEISQEELTQEDIDSAFSRPPRVTNNHIQWEGKVIYLLNGAHTGCAGVTEARIPDDQGQAIDVRLTSIERTLIDITVRPSYSGGVHQVARAFELAKNRLRVEELHAMLQTMRFVYPYHQAIGYYLERAGYESSAINMFRRREMTHDFYLTHDIPETRYESAWRLFVPSDL